MSISKMAEIYTELPDREVFQEILDENEGIVLIKFGADWCGPCKLISPYVKSWIEKLPAIFTVYDLDVDDNFEIYAYLKSKKMVSNIPCMLAYFNDNKTFASDESISGANESDYENFFIKCIDKYNSFA